MNGHDSNLPPCTESDPVPQVPSALLETSKASGRPTDLVHKHRASPHILVLLWCLYLLGIWLSSLQSDGPYLASHWTYWCLLAGFLMIWPALRLSQVGRGRHVGHALPDDIRYLTLTPGFIFMDWLCLVLVCQSVIWPLKLIASWTLWQTFWLDMCVIGWSMVTALLVAAGCRSPFSKHRTGAMLLCMGVFLGEPLLQAMFSRSWLMFVSPLHTASVLLKDPTESAMVHVLSVAGAGVLGWIILGFQTARSSCFRPHDTHDA